jgi:hypothetical protein
MVREPDTGHGPTPDHFTRDGSILQLEIAFVGPDGHCPQGNDLPGQVKIAIGWHA